LTTPYGAMSSSFSAIAVVVAECPARKELPRASGRLKDLPNISFHMEVQLIHAGIPDVRTLRDIGAQQAWLKLRENNASLSLSVLLALEGRLPGSMPPRSRRRGVRS
jgi:hypothetical protein